MGQQDGRTGGFIPLIGSIEETLYFSLVEMPLPH